MTERLCKCGCGEPMAADSKRDYRHGHKPKPGTALEITGVIEVEQPQVEPEIYVALELTERQLDRIYNSLPMTEKALGVLSALDADRS